MSYLFWSDADMRMVRKVLNTMQDSGDPSKTQVVLLRMKNDITEVMEAVSMEHRSGRSAVRGQCGCRVVLASEAILRYLTRKAFRSADWKNLTGMRGYYCFACRNQIRRRSDQPTVDVLMDCWRKDLMSCQCLCGNRVEVQFVNKYMRHDIGTSD